MTDATTPPESALDTPDATTPATTSPTTPAVPTGESGAAPRRRFRIDKTLLIVSLVIGVGLALVTRGLMIGVTGDDRAGLPPLIEEVNPVPQAEQALSQTSVFVDLASGYTGVLVIDGVELPTVDVSAVADDEVEPGQQVSLPAATVYEPGNATLSFTPTEAAAITEFDEGEHQVTVLYWALDETPQQARRFTWTFNVI
ncbi:MAG: hypothetical protein CL424_18105 [Acidimicrobiaceae bacterium]|nr:hypothetical protein [Acidimicrobiaceae bacterium]